MLRALHAFHQTLPGLSVLGAIFGFLMTADVPLWLVIPGAIPLGLYIVRCAGTWLANRPPAMTLGEEPSGSRLELTPETEEAATVDTRRSRRALS
jgi:hypothetical protein